uniref:Ceramide synthase 4a n=1 Tax=Neogobius melanostomus TaxID=47308 RepID=A0A8C6U7G1_9GOBI
MEAVLNEWIWRHDLWLPPGIHWEDIQVDPEQGHVPRPRDLTYTVPLAFAFIACRYVFESACVSTYLFQNDVLSLSTQCGLSQRKVETWFRRRRNQDRPNNTKKFCEATWRFLFYFVSFIAGLNSLVKTPWFWDQRECWRGYPNQPVSDAQYWYYTFEMGFYLSLLLCVSVDVKRKDFKEQVIHHVATIFLISFSYCANYVRVGTLVMLLHDSSDFFLESAKMFHYAGLTCICDTLFVIFAVVFLFSRLVVFPFRVVYTTLFMSMDFFKPFFGYYFFNALLLVLQALHIFWAYIILRMVYKFVFAGKVAKDDRSDEESEGDNEEELEDERDGENREQRKDSINSKLSSLANNCVLNNLTNQGNINSRLPKAR